MVTMLCTHEDPYLCDLLHYVLTREGFTVQTAATRREVLHALRATRPDPVLLSATLPALEGAQGLSLVRHLCRAPIMVLAPHAEEAAVVAALEQGADDYVVLPLHPQILVLRLKAILRRAHATPSAAVPPRWYRLGDLTFDAEHHLVRGDQAELTLTPTESRLLQELVQQPGQVLSAERLLERIQGYDSAAQPSVIVMDVRLPDGTGIEACRDIWAEWTQPHDGLIVWDVILAPKAATLCRDMGWRRGCTSRSSGLSAWPRTVTALPVRWLPENADNDMVGLLLRKHQRQS